MTDLISLFTEFYMIQVETATSKATVVDDGFVVNAAPIHDALLLDCFDDGSSQLVCCCGMGRGGSLRRAVSVSRVGAK